MKKKTLRNSFFLLITALVWGIAFVAQNEGGDAIGPYSFNCIRSLLGALVLLPVIALLDRLKLSRKPETPEQKKTLLKGGILCGIILFIASNLQQLGMYFGAPSGKAGFLTACYILIVPILGIFLRRKCPLQVWFGVLFSLIGLYLLCIDGAFALKISDSLLLLCALMFSFHILVVDRFSPLVDGIRMSCIQFLVCGILTAVPMLLFDIAGSSSGFSGWLPAFLSWKAWIPILYAGGCSCGVGYTLQIVGQEDVNPSIASLIMSLESVFSVLAGAVLLHEYLKPRELFGCVLIFAAVILAQLPSRKQNS